MTSEYKQWAEEYAEELEEMYEAYLSHGRVLFGSAFHQLGTLADYRRFVFCHLQPGAAELLNT